MLYTVYSTARKYLIPSVLMWSFTGDHLADEECALNVLYCRSCCYPPRCSLELDREDSTAAGGGRENDVFDGSENGIIEGCQESLTRTPARYLRTNHYVL
jgi:hypothetical protein